MNMAPGRPTPRASDWLFMTQCCLNIEATWGQLTKSSMVMLPPLNRVKRQLTKLSMVILPPLVCSFFLINVSSPHTDNDSVLRGASVTER